MVGGWVEKDVGGSDGGCRKGGREDIGRALAHSIAILNGLIQFNRFVFKCNRVSGARGCLGLNSCAWTSALCKHVVLYAKTSNAHIFCI